MLSIKQGRTKYHFWVFGMARPGIEPSTPGYSNFYAFMLDL